MGESLNHTVVFATGRREGEIEGVEKHLFRDQIEIVPETHSFVQSTETAVKMGQDAYRIATLDADGEAVGRLPLLHQSSGVCYLRLRSMAEGSEEGGLLVDRVRMERLDGRSRGEGSEGNAGR